MASSSSSSSTFIPGWLLAHGLYDLGIAFFVHVQLGARAFSSTTVLQKSFNTSGVGGGGLPSILGLNRLRKDAAIGDNDDNPSSPIGSAQETIEAAGKSMQKALDCQTFIASLFTKDVVQLCKYIRMLEAPLTRDVDVMIAAADKDDDARFARDFRSRLDAVTIAYEPLINQMITAAEHNTSTFPSIALRDAAKAEMHANLLYAWARTHVPMDASTQIKTDKAAKLKLIPYIVVMAYAVRVKLDVHFVESSGVDEAERLEYLKRSHAVVDEFMKVIEMALLVTIHKTSLVDMAMDYNVALTTYVTLMEAMRTTAQMAFQPKDKLMPTALWNDGLSGIRAIFCNEDDETNSTPSAIIALDSVEEIIKWTQLIGYDLKDLDLADLSHTIHIHKLLFLLGADFDDKSTASIRLAPDYKRGLLDFLPADCLRSAFQAELAKAINVAPSHQAIASSAKTRNATQLTTAQLPSTPASAPLNPRLTRTFTVRSAPLWDVAVSPDGQLVASIGDKEGMAWNSSRGRQLRSSDHSSDPVQCMALSSDSTWVVTGGAGAHPLRTWNMNSQRPAKTLDSCSSVVYAVAISPDDCTVASASSNRTIKLWDVHSEKCSATLKGHSNEVRCVAWSADGHTLASGSADSTIKVWSVRSLTLLRTIDHPGLTGTVTEVTFAGDVLVSCSGNKIFKAWKWQSGRLQSTFFEHSDGVNCLVPFPDYERVASGGKDGMVRIWSLRSRMCEHTLEGHTGEVKSVAVSRDGRTLVSGSDDKSVKVWRLR